MFATDVHIMYVMHMYTTLIIVSCKKCTIYLKFHHKKRYSIRTHLFFQPIYVTSAIKLLKKGVRGDIGENLFWNFLIDILIDWQDGCSCKCTTTIGHVCSCVVYIFKKYLYSLEITIIFILLFTCFLPFDYACNPL